MPRNFTQSLNFDKKTVFASFVPQMRNDGMYYEVNVKGYPRFYMTWSPLERFDIVSGEDLDLPYNLILAASDAIEQHKEES